MDATTIILDLLRHGEPEGGPRFRGHGCDDPLSERGWQQAWNAVGGTRKPGSWQRVVSSPMRRCRAFAEAFAAHAKLGPVLVYEDLREIGFGRWEGLTRAEVAVHYPDEFAAYEDDPARHRPLGAEPLSDFRQRVCAARDALVEELGAELGAEHLRGAASGAGRGSDRDTVRVLVVAHAGTLRALIGAVLDLPDTALHRIVCPYASGTRLVHGAHRGWSIAFSNRTCLIDP